MLLDHHRTRVFRCSPRIRQGRESKGAGCREIPGICAALMGTTQIWKVTKFVFNLKLPLRGERYWELEYGKLQGDLGITRY